MKKSYYAERRPYIAFNGPQFELLDPREQDSLGQPMVYDVQVGIIFENVGKVLAHYEVESMKVELNGIVIENPSFINTGGHLYPGKTSVFRYETFKDVRITDIPVIGSIEYTLKYNSIPRSKTHISKRKISLFLPTWYSTDGSRYIFIEEQES